MSKTDFLDLLLRCKNGKQATTMLIFKVLRNRAISEIASTNPEKTLSDRELLYLDAECLAQAKKLSSEAFRKSRANTGSKPSP